MKKQAVKKAMGYILLGITVITLICGFSSLTKGFDKKDNYANYESYSSLNKNAYVGGDAYNYIINGTYFTGYCTLAGCMFIVAAVCGTSGLKFLFCDEHNENPQTKVLDHGTGESAPADDDSVVNTNMESGCK